MSAATQKWVDVAIATLFNPESKRLDAILDKIVQRQVELSGEQSYGITYLGSRHILARYEQSIRNIRSRDIKTINKLVPAPRRELNEAVGQYIADYNVILLDRKQISQILWKLTFQANNLQEIRDAFPDCISQLIPLFAAMPRFRAEPTYLIESDWRGVREYLKILPRIEFYAMTRLIY